MMKFKKYIADWLHAKNLKKLGITEEEWQKQHDPNHNPKASSIEQFYHGYNHLHEFTTVREYPFTTFSTLTLAIDAMHRWCIENCNDRWRDDLLCVYNAPNIDWADNADHDLASKAILFYAFKDEQDYMMFKLKWT